MAKDREVLQKTWEQMQANLSVLNASGPLDSSKLQFSWYWSAGETSAWQTARDTGALVLMPHDEAQRYADVYFQQASVNEAARVHTAERNDSAAAIEPRCSGARQIGRRDTHAGRTQAARAGLPDCLSQIGLVLDLSASLDDLYRGAE